MRGGALAAGATFTHGLCHSLAVVGIGAAKIADRPLDDVVAAYLGQPRRDIRDQPLLRRLVHHAVERTRLDEVVVLPMTLLRLRAREALDGDRRPKLLIALHGPVEAVRLVIFRASTVAVKAHRAVAQVVSRLDRVRTVNRQLRVVGAQAITMGIAVREKTPL